jgi:hypothetical protein
MGLPHAAARVTSVLLVALIWIAVPSAERMGYGSEEFAGRRQRLATSLQRGTLVMFGAFIQMG